MLNTRIFSPGNPITGYVRVFVLIMLVGAPAAAEVVVQPTEMTQRTPFDDQDPDPPVVTNRARPFTGNLEISLLFTPTVIERYINHLGGLIGVGYHVNNWFAIEALGGYQYMREATIIGGEAGVRARIGGTREPYLSGLLGMTWTALAGLNLSPIYGKLNLFSEVDFNSQVYLILGAGAVGVVKRELAGTDAIETIAVNQGTRVALNAGIGFRLFLTKWMALRVELRDIIYWDTAVLTANGDEQLDFYNNFTGCFGLSFIVN